MEEWQGHGRVAKAWKSGEGMEEWHGHGGVARAGRSGEGMDTGARFSPFGFDIPEMGNRSMNILENLPKIYRGTFFVPGWGSTPPQKGTTRLRVIYCLPVSCIACLMCVLLV